MTKENDKLRVTVSGMFTLGGTIHWQHGACLLHGRDEEGLYINFRLFYKNKKKKTCAKAYQGNLRKE
ncbi:hypothetical protein [Methylocucumis oryzae]|uniref:hypothetical protein n=1 Tax=Methylocucumis oryzae TaxID=1632867 RepID=UPI0019552FBA|nr:hypothetical protein [Methylocucumis oryzae]